MSAADDAAPGPGADSGAAPPQAAGIILAAGSSSRMGSPKALLDAGGATFLARLAEALRRGGCAPIVAVVARGDGEVAAHAAECGARVVVNPGGEGGQIGSLRAGISHLQGLDDPPAAFVFTPVDNPGVAAATVRALLGAWRESGAAAAGERGGPGAAIAGARGGPRAVIVVPRRGSRRGHPVLADMAIADEFFAAGLREGARGVVRRDPSRVVEVEVDDPGIADDLDTPGRYGRFRAEASPARTAARVLEALERGERIWTAVVVEAEDGAIVGRRRWLSGRGGRGTLGSPSLDDAVAAAVPALFPPNESRGAVARDFGYRDGGVAATARVYVELHGPAARMVIVGAGHIAGPLCAMGALLGMRVEVLDDRAEFAAAERFPEAGAVRTIDFRDPFAGMRLGPSDHVVLVTRGHSFDYECLVRLLRMGAPPGYIGMIGSRRRVRATHEQLAREGFGADAMKLVRAPVGLDLGGQTPAEIAVAVAAEIVMLRAGGTGEALVDKERIVERFFAGGAGVGDAGAGAGVGEADAGARATGAGA